MKKRPASIIRSIFAILLVILLGYTFFKFNQPNPTFTNLYEILTYIFPILIALAYLTDNWDRSESTKRKILKCTIILTAATIMGIFSGLGKKIDENQQLGIVILGAFLSTLSGVFFYFASFQNRALFENSLILRNCYRFAIGCFVFSFLQIPFWSLITGHFPPRDFTEIGALVATIGFILSLLGPASPWIVGFIRELIEINKQNRESKK